MKFSIKQENAVEDYLEMVSKKSGVNAMERMEEKLSRKERFFVCLMKGFLIFLAVYGSVGLFITTFSLPCYQSTLLFITLILSLVAALLYYNRKIFNIGYILYFVIFLVFVRFTFFYANSGINAILNVVMEEISDIMHLDSYREYTELINDRYSTITICLLMIIFFSVLAFNSTISGYSKPSVLLLQLLPSLLICLYFDGTIHPVYAGMMSASFIGVLLMRRSDRYRINITKKKDSIRIKNQMIHYRERGFLETIFAINVTGWAAVICFLILGIILLRFVPYRYQNNRSTMKDFTDPYVEAFTINGLQGLFHQNTASGGLNGGTLGQVGQISSYSRTDLQVMFVPTGNDVVYLKGYVGEIYEKNQWKSDGDYSQFRKYPFSDQTPLKLSKLTSQALHNAYLAGEQYMTAEAVMSIFNVAANPNYFYRPYYMDTASVMNSQPNDSEYNIGSVYGGDNIIARLPVNSGTTITYYPLFSDEEVASYMDRALEKSYREYVYEHYLTVPDSCLKAVQTVCESQGFSGDRDEVITMIKQYFYNQYLYSLNPGRTPSGKDFVTYFLENQKKGYCAHFASAGVMMLRYMGIPARYVEGYAFDLSEDRDIIKTDEDLAYWYDGYNPFITDDADAGVLSVEVLDSDAHAWAEIYIDSLGWVPVEFTIAEEETVFDDGGSFWNRFQNLFSSNENQEDVNANANALFVENTKNFVLGTFVWILIGIFAAFYLLRLLRVYLLYYANSNKRLVRQYQAFTKIMKKNHLVNQQNVYHEMALEYLTNQLSLPKEETESYIADVELASYGNEILSKEQLRKDTKYFRTVILPAVQNQLSIRRRLLVRIQY